MKTKELIAQRRQHKKGMRVPTLMYNRIFPFDEDIFEVLEDLLEYMEDREDVKDGQSGLSPNAEMQFANRIRQCLYQLEKEESNL